MQQQRRLKQQITLEDLEECFQDFDARHVQPKGDRNKERSKQRNFKKLIIPQQMMVINTNQRRKIKRKDCLVI